MKSNNLLAKILQNKEERVKKQEHLRAKYGSCVLSLSINIPGAKKDSKEAKIIYEVALEEIKKLELSKQEAIFTEKDTGFEALFSLNIDAKVLKILTCKIEETHPLGRFMDIDVIDTDGIILSRNYQRKCYICKANAKECARAQKHSSKELLSYISQKVYDYQSSL